MKQMIGHFLGTVLLFLALVPASYAQVSPPPPYFGTNPSLSAIKASLIYWGHHYQVPPHILFGIASQEGRPAPYNVGWLQYNPNDGGRTVYHQEPSGKNGVGIMQITVDPGDANYKRLCTDYDYNIQRGAAYLADASNPASCWRNSPIIGNNERAKLENWFYAIWTYNGLDANIISRAYPDAVLSKIANCDNGQWSNLSITAPTVAQTNGHHTIPNTPTPFHIDANFDGNVVLGGGSGGSDTDIWVDKGNGAQGQDGSAGNPYNTVKAAVDRANATQSVTIHIVPGTYSEKIGTGKHIHFVTNGSGTVRIGG